MGSALARPRRAYGVAILLCVALRPLAAGAVALPPGFRDTVVFTGLTEPTAVRFAADGRVFVAEKSGLVKVFPDVNTNTATVFADLRTNVYNFWDRGLLSMALHPDFPATPYIYVLYTLDAEIGGTPPRWGMPGATSDGCPDPTSDGCIAAGRLSRLQALGNVMTGSEQVLVENWCQQYPSLSVGTVLFGTDGALYVSAGSAASFSFVDYGQDGDPLNPCGDPPAGVGGTETPPTAAGGALRSQNLGVAGYGMATYDGKILRLDPFTGAAAAGNPLQGSGVPGADRIFASGFRQPFRMTARRGTDEVWLGDVGWKEWDEIDRVATGPAAVVANFGWPCFEGPERQAGFEAANLDVCAHLYDAGTAAAPFFAYHSYEAVVDGDGCSVDNTSLSAIAFHSGGGYGAAYDGALFFGDYSRGCIWAMPKGGDGSPDVAARFLFEGGAAIPSICRPAPAAISFMPTSPAGRFGASSSTTAISRRWPSSTPTSPAAPCRSRCNSTLRIRAIRTRATR